MGVGAFLWQFWTVTAWAHKEGVKRAEKFGQSTYNFLPHREVVGAFKIFDLIAGAIEGVIEWKRKK